MSNPTPLISIIMPAYNAARFITESIGSILRQSYRHWELIVVDDGSTDATVACIQGFQDPRIRLIQSEHIGFLGAVRNMGLKAAQGEFIAFMDADDLYEETALTHLLDHLRQNPDCTAVYGFARWIDEQGAFLPNTAYRGIKPVPGSDELVDVSQYRHTWRAILASDVPNWVQGLLLRRETFERVGYQSETLTFVPDFNYFIRLFQDNFDGVHCINRYVFRYRICQSGITRNQARFLEALAQISTYCNWIFSPEGIPGEYHDLDSEIRAIHYAHMARSRLQNRDFSQLSHCLMTALLHPKVTFKDWLLYCFPYWIRYISPSGLDMQLRRLWAKYKEAVIYGKLRFRYQQSAS